MNAAETTTNAHPSELLTVKEAAARFRLSYWTLYRWIQTGRLNENTGLRKLGRRRLIEFEVTRSAIQRGELGG